MKQILRSLLGKKKPGRLDEPRTPVHQPVKPKAGSASAPQTPNKKDSAPQESNNTKSTTSAQSTAPQGKAQDRSVQGGQSKDSAKKTPAGKPAKATESKPTAAKDTARPEAAKPHSGAANSAKPQQAKAASQSPADKAATNKPASQKSASKPAATKQSKPEASPKPAAVEKQPQSNAQEKKPRRKAHEPVQRPRRGASFSSTTSPSSPKADSARDTSPKPAGKPGKKPSQKGAAKPSQQARPAAQQPEKTTKPSTSPNPKKSSPKPASPHPSTAQAQAPSKPAKQQKTKPQQTNPATAKPAAAKPAAGQQQQTQKPRPQKRGQEDTAKETTQPQPAPKKKAQPSKGSQPSQGKGETRTPSTTNQKAAPQASAPNTPTQKKSTTAPKPKATAPKTGATPSQQRTRPTQDKAAHNRDKVAQPKKDQSGSSKGSLDKQQEQRPQPHSKASTPQNKARKTTKRRPEVKPSDISRGLARKSQQVGTPTSAQQKPPRAVPKPKAKQQSGKPQPKKAEPQAAPKAASAKTGTSAATGGVAGAGAATTAAAAAARERQRDKAQPSKAPQPAPKKPKAPVATAQAQPAAQKPAPQKAAAPQEDAKSKYPLLQKQANDPEALATPPESKVVKKKRHARLRQVKGLDGLRGLAVIAVVLYHFFPSLLPGGYLGVDLFFVLSGFLITSLLVREFRTSGTISLKDFWVRRFRRILPAAVSVLVMCTALVAWIGGDLAVGLRQQFLGTLFFVNNWTQIATSQSYFADNEIQVFAHYWSLAVEEQFYVIWPLLITGVFLISRRKPRRLPILVAAVLAIGSAVAMALIYVPGEDPTRVYYGTDTHAFGLLTGAVLSLLMTSTKSDPKADSWATAGKSESRIAGVIGTLALLGYGAQLFFMPDDAEITYRGGLLLTSVLGVLMVWGVVREYGPMTPLFRTKVMRWFGQRSFSLYLWHWPVIMILKALFEGNQNSDKSWILGLVAVPISLLLSEISYQFIENPFRRGGYKKTWKTYWSSRPGFSELRDGFGKTMWPVVPFLVIASVAGVVYGVINSSDKTELEQQLEQLQQQNQSSNNAPLQPNNAAPQPPAEDEDQASSKDKKTRPMPQGKDITAVGDSVMLASSGALKQRFPQIYVDADVSRHYTAGIQVLQQLKDSGQLRDTVFLGFGTNGPAFPDQIKEALDIIGKDRTVVMAVPYGDREWMSQSQQDVIDAAEEYDNVYIADWCGHAQSDPAILYSDGVHPMPERTGEYSDAFYDALKQYSKYDKTVSSQCSPQ